MKMTLNKKRRLSEGEKIALGELRGMIPFFLVCNGIILAGCVVYCVFAGFDYSLFTGLIFGNTISALNFYVMAFSAGRLTAGRVSKNPRRFVAIGYGLRVVVMFALYYALMTFGFINPVPALIPLLFPSFYYKFKAIFNKSV